MKIHNTILWMHAGMRAKKNKERLDGESLINKFLLIAILVIPLSADAQKSLPNNIDLRASYCVAFHKKIVSENAPILADEGKSAGVYGAEFVEQIRSSTASSENDLSRLRSYILPRLKFLDSEALIFAADQFPKDRQFLQNCQSKCSSLECLNACAVSTGYQEKARWCSGLNWIPF